MRIRSTRPLSTKCYSGVGNATNYPYESLRTYYQRSSYGKLNITGNVLGWYRAKNNRDYYTDHADWVIEEAIAAYAGSHDFTQYDNNGDGVIDYFCTYWTGPIGAWASFWWAWMDSSSPDPNYRIQGKALGGFSWEWEGDDPLVIIHETGHALGLPDYYDYDDTVGPRGGVGGLDMMDYNWGDHNCFSKWILDWIQPTVVSSIADARTIALNPSATAADARRGDAGHDIDEPVHRVLHGSEPYPYRQ